MERMLAVVFNEESKAYEGSRALNQLDAEGSIAVHAAQVIQKNADGTASIKKTEDDFPIRTMEGAWIGSLIGVLGGPVGLGVGAVVGTTAGAIGDLRMADVNADFLNEVSDALKPGNYAVIADVSEEWVTPVDSRMEALGGVVFRTTRENFEEEQRAREVSMLKAEIKELEAEHAQTRAEHKAKLQAKIDNLNTKLQRKLEEAKQRSEQIKNETNAKVQALQQKAAKAQGNAKAAIEARITQMREEYDRSTTKARAAGA